MTIEYIRYQLTEHSSDQLQAAYEKAAKHLESAPECLGYELSRCEEQPSSFVLRIEWASTEAHLLAFRKGENFPRFLQEVRPFVGEITEMRHYSVTRVAWTRHVDRS